MKKWNSIRKFLKANVGYLGACTLAVVVLFFVMQSELPLSDFAFCVVTVVIVAKIHRRDKIRRSMLDKYILLENYMENMRYEILGNKSSPLFFGNFGMELFEVTKMEEQYYYRIFCGFFEAYNVLGSEDDDDVTDMMGSLQNAVIKEHDLQKKLRTELAGLRWIILAAIPGMPLVRLWVTTNMREMDLYYSEAGGVLVKYGIWIFTLLVFLLFDRLGEIKSEGYT